MFARFRLEGTKEINVNVSLVRDFEPGDEAGTTKLNFLGGDSRQIPFSNQSVRHAFKKAAKDHMSGYPEPEKPATPTA